MRRTYRFLVLTLFLCMMSSLVVAGGRSEAIPDPGESRVVRHPERFL